ncbi:MAG TPA: porin [Terriglobales bacterium]|jgi:hypothetical protein
MKEHCSVTRLLSGAALIVALAAAPMCSAQTQTIADASQPNVAPTTASYSADQPSTAVLANRIDDLEKQLVVMRGQLAMQKTDTPTMATADVPSPLTDQAAAAPAAPAAPTIAGLLGPTTLSGFVDVYYGYNSNQPASRTTALRNFDINSGQFGLNMIELVADKAPDPTASHVGYHVALGFGQAMNIINSGEAGQFGTEGNFDQYLKEGYLEYLMGKKFQINVGKFVTPAGAEVIESKDNWNYSRGDLFALAIPYFHFGASAKYSFSPKFSLTGYLVNGWNNSIDNNAGKTTGFSAAWTPNAKFSLYQNYLVGPEQSNDDNDFRHLFDTVVSYNATSKLSVMGNFDYGHDDVVGADGANPLVNAAAWWSGIAGYVKYAPNANWYWAVRGEYYNDHNGFTTGTLGTEDHLSEFTFTMQRLLASKIMARAEYRYDHSDNAVFPYRADQFGPIDHQNTITIGMIYAFSSADAK